MSEKIFLPSEGAHGEKNGTATATCYCGEVQIEVPTEGEGLVDTFICHCTDCRKITARYEVLSCSDHVTPTDPLTACSHPTSSSKTPI
jgi:hypothetical protein